MYDVELVGIAKRFGSVPALEDISLSVRHGEFLTLLGPSGCGKTTLMKIIAGLIAPTIGDVIVRGQRVNDLPPYQRDVSLMFQNYALFPHKTVFDNIAFGLKYRGVKKADRADPVRRILELVRLPGMDSRYPHQLSGGQQQRIALARSLVVNPAVLLLDEPLSNLDQKLRVGMRVELKQIQESAQVTFVFVTHDQNEALALSDRIVVMNKGHILQVGTPKEIYERPTSRFVADFIGQSNFFNGAIVDYSNANLKFRTNSGVELTIKAPTAVVPTHGRAVVQVRAEHVRLQTEEPTDENRFRGTVERVVYEGTVVIYRLRLAQGDPLTVSAPGKAQTIDTGATVWVSFAASDCVLVPE